MNAAVNVPARTRRERQGVPDEPEGRCVHGPRAGRLRAAYATSRRRSGARPRSSARPRIRGAPADLNPPGEHSTPEVRRVFGPPSSRVPSPVPPRALRQRVHDRPEVVHRAMEPRIPPYGLPKPPDRRQESTLAHPRISLQRRHLLEREPQLFCACVLCVRDAAHSTAARYFSHACLHIALASAASPASPLSLARSPSAMPQLYSVEMELARRSRALAYLAHASINIASRRFGSIEALLRALRLLLQHQRPGVVRVEVGRGPRAPRRRVPLGSQIGSLSLARRRRRRWRRRSPAGT